MNNPNQTLIRLSAEFFGRKGTFVLKVGPWAENQIEFRFEDPILNTSGSILFNGETHEAQIRMDSFAENPFDSPSQKKDYFLTLLNGFIDSYRFGWSPKESQILYDQAYHEENGYHVHSDSEVQIKAVQAEIIERLAGPAKTLIAGCSAGQLIHQCRKRKTETYGFDIIQNIEQIVFPEVQEFVRTGSLTQIPFGPEDGFVTLVAVDVLEHIPEKDLPQMVSELKRLNFQKLIFLINLNDCGFPGHVTLRPLTWWADQWKEDYTLSRVEGRFSDLPLLYSNDGDYNHQWTLWEKKK